MRVWRQRWWRLPSDLPPADGVWILVPAKAGPDAKLRLSAVLGAEARENLMTVLLRRTLDAVDGARATGSTVVAGVAVAARDAAAVAEALRRGLPVLPDEGTGPNPAVAAAALWCAHQGATLVAVIAADLPLVNAEAVTALLRRARPGCLVIAPDRLGAGTNALALPAGEFEFAFGPGSFAAHSRSARARRWAVEPLRTPALAVDLDEPGDLDLMQDWI